MAAALAVCVAFAAVMPEVYAKDAKKKAKPKAGPEKCVKLTETQVDDYTMTFALDNTCGAKRECTIKWAVTCDGGQPDEREVLADLAADAQETWTVSAAHCGDAGYVISAPKWSCKRPSGDSAAR